MRDIQAFSEQVVREFKPQRIILFGSHASGAATTDSDVDLLVILRYRGHPIRKSAEILERTDPDFAVDLIVRSPAELRKRLAQHDWFLLDIIKEGKVLYDSSDA